MTLINEALITLNIKRINQEIDEIKSSIPESIVGEKGERGPKGRDGKDADNDYIVNTLKEDNTFLSQLKGSDGVNGRDGKDANPIDISNILKQDTSFIKTVKEDLLDESSYNTLHSILKEDQTFISLIKGDNGKDGLDGKDGRDGKDVDNEFVINTLKEDQTFISQIKGDKGKDGRDGKDGLDGKDGRDGKDGLDGKDGRDGKDVDNEFIINALKKDDVFKSELKGRDGRDGKDGLDGKDGETPSKKYLIQLIEPIITNSEKNIKSSISKETDEQINKKINSHFEKIQKINDDKFEEVEEETEKKIATSVTNMRKEMRGFREDLHKTLRDVRDEYNQKGSPYGLGGFGGGAGVTLMNELLGSKDVERTPVEEIETNSILIWDADLKKFYVEGIINILDRLKVELEVQYDRLVDVEGDYTYIGEATPGSTKGESVWRIKRIKQIGEDIEIRWAEGNDNFDKSWIDRLNYTYLE